MADLDKLFVYELYTSLAGYFEELDLRFDEKVKGEFGNEKTWSRTSGVTDCGSNVKNGEILSRIYCLEGVAENRIKDVVYPCTTTELFC